MQSKFPSQTMSARALNLPTVSTCSFIPLPSLEKTPSIMLCTRATLILGLSWALVSLSEETTIPSLNIYDKGFCAKMTAWQHGRQLVSQPNIKKSDKKFNRIQTISSASVSTDCGGSERVVNVSKRAGLISRGFQPNADPI